ncbi:MAG: heparinase II/III family protein [Bacteroidota bacterium]
MKLFFKSLILITLIQLALSVNSALAQHPSLILTKKGVSAIKKEYRSYPLFRNKYETVKEKIDAVIPRPIAVPIPKDAGGGYTHERHKANYTEMLEAGTLFQISGDAKYADFVKKMLMAYADIYQKLPLHPERKHNPAGKLFWQSLNESVWLVHVAQAYDCIYNYLSAKERSRIEKELLKPCVELLSTQNPETFNKIHNHGTWSVAAVGMAGFVMGDQDLVEKALLGLDKSGKGGFYAQLDQLFSPDGYYTEGPYYQRYALMPFVLFAQSVETNQPELKIFEYRNGILQKAVNCIFQLSYNGKFFPINDAIKEKGIDSPEIVYGVDIVYALEQNSSELLAAAAIQKDVILSEQGLVVAKALKDQPAFKFPLPSQTLTDGKAGQSGAISIMRDGKSNGKTAVFKYTSHGLAHGHYDKLSLIFYDEGNEILADYGASRYLNVPQKYGGRYLRENKSFAKQSIAHNNLIVDEMSHFNGNYKLSSAHHPDEYFKDFDSNKSYQVVSAKEHNAYPGVTIHRTLMILSETSFSNDLLVDIVRTEVKDEATHTYDLPYYYYGQLIETNPVVRKNTDKIEVFGEGAGYQHLWVEGKSEFGKLPSSFTFLNQNRFYTLSMVSNVNGTVYLNRIGANDPDFNLKNDPSIHFRTRTKDLLQITLIEPHGNYNPVTEVTLDSYSLVANLNIENDTKEYSAFSFKKKGSDASYVIIIANQDSDKAVQHTLTINGIAYEWKGPIYVTSNQE